MKVKIHVETWGGNIFLKKDYLKEVSEERLKDRNRMDRLCMRCAESLVLDNEEAIFQSLPRSVQERFDYTPEFWDNLIEGAVDNAEWFWERV